MKELGCFCALSSGLIGAAVFPETLFKDLHWEFSVCYAELIQSFFILTPDFSNYLCFLIIMVLAFVEHIIVFKAISFI